MHTDHTLKILDATTISLGQQFRVFVNTTCSAFDTRELDREANARKRRKAKEPGANLNNTTTTSRRRKKFNLETYKYHSLGDYRAMIEMFGTCDSYTTEVVSEIGHYQTSSNSWCT
jgi:hypothetical protein